MFARLSLILLGLPFITSSPIESRQLSTSDTENDLENGTPCKDITVIFARGTTESGNVGTSAGPPFFQALANLVDASNLAVQGVNYSASIVGFLEGGDPTGSTAMASLVTQAFTQCPNTSVVMSGYRYALFPISSGFGSYFYRSQGGQLVHNAAKALPAATTAKVSSGMDCLFPFTVHSSHSP